jgi:hypothetical protein
MVTFFDTTWIVKALLYLARDSCEGDGGETRDEFGGLLGWWGCWSGGKEGIRYFVWRVCITT